MDQTFNQLDIAYSAASKTLTCANPGYEAELAALNALHRSMIASSSGLDASHGTPPPPQAVRPQRSAQIAKAREAGNAAQRAGKHADAVRMYGLATDISLARPHWEPAALFQDETFLLYSNRAQAQMGLRRWPEAAVDAKTSAVVKKVGNPKAYWKRVSSLMEMGRWEEARDYVGEAIENEGRADDLVELQKQIHDRIGEKEES